MVTDKKTHEVTGDVTPDCTGDYLPHVIHSDKMSYRRQDDAYFIWWDGASWYISTALGVPGESWWERPAPNMEGGYLPGGGADGEATVTEI